MNKKLVYCEQCDKIYITDEETANCEICGSKLLETGVSYTDWERMTDAAKKEVLEKNRKNKKRKERKTFLTKVFIFTFPLLVVVGVVSSVFNLESTSTNNNKTLDNQQNETEIVETNNQSDDTSTVDQEQIEDTETVVLLKDVKSYAYTYAYSINYADVTNSEPEKKIENFGNVSYKYDDHYALQSITINKPALPGYSMVDRIFIQYKDGLVTRTVTTFLSGGEMQHRTSEDFFYDNDNRLIRLEWRQEPTNKESITEYKYDSDGVYRKRQGGDNSWERILSYD